MLDAISSVSHNGTPPLVYNCVNCGIVTHILSSELTGNVIALSRANGTYGERDTSGIQHVNQGSRRRRFVTNFVPDFISLAAIKSSVNSRQSFINLHSKDTVGRY